jgi:hypothetical protein
MPRNGEKALVVLSGAAVAWAYAPTSDILAAIAAGGAIVVVRAAWPQRAQRAAPAGPARIITPWDGVVIKPLSRGAATWDVVVEPLRDQRSESGVAMMVSANGDRVLWRVGEQFVFQSRTLDGAEVWRPITVLAARQFLTA